MDGMWIIEELSNPLTTLERKKDLYQAAYLLAKGNIYLLFEYLDTTGDKEYLETLQKMIEEKLSK